MGTYFPQYDTANTTSRVSPKINTTAPGALAPRTIPPPLGSPGNPIQLNPTPVQSPRTPTPARVSPGPTPRPNVTAGVTGRVTRQTSGRAGGWVGAKAAAAARASQAGGAIATGALTSQADSPLPGPADVVGGAIAIGGTVVAAGGLALDLYNLYRGLQPQPSLAPNSPQNITPTQLEGGQCPGVSYSVFGVIRIPANGVNPPSNQSFGPINVPGPIRLDYRSSGGGQNTAIGFTYGANSLYYALASGRVADPPQFLSFEATRRDGLPDDCGNPPGLPQPAGPEVGTRQRPGTPFAPTIRPQPGRPGQPYPTPQPNPQPGADGQPGTDGEPAPNPGPYPYPTPNPGPTPTPDPRTDPRPDTNPPTQPEQPDEPEQPDSSCDPCAKIDQLTELLIEAFSDSGSGLVALPPCEDEEEQSNDANN